MLSISSRVGFGFCLRTYSMGNSSALKSMKCLKTNNASLIFSICLVLIVLSSINKTLPKML